MRWIPPKPAMRKPVNWIDALMRDVLGSWGIDGHNSHTNVCSSAARLGYTIMSGGDRPSPDFAHARTISHIGTAHRHARAPRWDD